MRFSTFLFDLDGTLVDSVADLATGVNLLRRDLDLPPLSREQVRANVGDGATELVKRSLPAGLFSPARLQAFLAHYAAHLADQTVLYPGIAAFLERLAGCRLAVVTNKPLDLSIALLERLDLRERFPVVIGGDSCPVKKPYPVPVQLALHRLGATAESAVLIGDHHTDLAAGAAAGVATCFCAWGLGHDNGLPADFRAATPLELEQLLA